MAVKFSNNAKTLLSSGITSSATSISVSDASAWPTLYTGDYSLATLVDISDNTIFEIVKVTAISSNTLTVARGQEGTTARAFNSGDKVELRLTAGLLEQALTGTDVVKLDSLTASATASYSLAVGGVAYSPANANALIVSLNGVTQEPNSAFTVSGSTITFSSALTANDSIDYIVDMAKTLDIGEPSDNTVSPDKLTSAVNLDAITDNGATTTNAVTVGNLTANGTVEFDGLSGTGAVTVTDILDQDDMSSNSATALATQQSIKAYVDAQVDTADALPEVLANGNTTGGTDIAVGTGDDITFADSSNAIFGDGSDLKIRHDATNSVIDNYTGNLIIRNYANDQDITLQSDDGTGGLTAYFRADGSTGGARLYHYGSEKIATTSEGVEVTGIIDADTGRIARPSTFWSSHYVGISNYGGLATQGNYDLHLTTGGYRNSSGTWTSFGLNGKTGAAQIALDSDGEIGFNTEASKASGTGTGIARRMTLSDSTLDVEVDVDVDGTVTATNTSLTHSTATRNSDTVFYSSTGNSVLKNNATGMRSSLNVPTRTGGDASGTWGINITGDAGTVGGLNASSFLRSDVNDTANGQITFAGRVNIRGHLDLSDNEVLYFGSGDDVEFFCNGSHMYTDLNSGIGNWYIRDGSTTRFTFDDAGHFTATGNITATDVYVADQIIHTGDTNTYMQFHAADQWRVVTGGSERLEVNNSTITAKRPIKVDNIACETGQQLVLSAGESSGVASGQTGELVYVNAEGGLQVNSSPNNWSSGWAGRYTATICNNAGQALFPFGRIVDGSIQAQNSASPRLMLLSGSDANYKVNLRCNYENESMTLTGGSNYKILGAEGFSSPNSILFYASNDVKMKLKDNNQLLIGTTASQGGTSANAGVVITDTNNASTSARLAVKSNTNTFLRFARFGSATDSLMSIGNNYHRDSGNYAADNTSYGTHNITFRADGEMRFATGAAGTSAPTTRVYISNGGVLKVPAVYTTDVGSSRDVFVNSSGQIGYVSSTRESKTNIQALDDISWLYNLNTVSFNYRKRDSVAGEYLDGAEEDTEYGLIAEEVEQVNPDLCFYNENDEGEQSLAGVSYRKLIPVLTKALQEQQMTIEALTQRIEQLEAN